MLSLKTKIFLKSKFTTGFTLVEVIVVIGIIAILTTIAYASLTQIRAKSRDQKRIADLHEIQLSLELYFNKNSRYPEILWPLNVNQNPLSLFGYLSSAPKAPSVGEIYHYIPIKRSSESDRCVSYHLWTTLELKSAVLDSKKGYDSSEQITCGISFGTDERIDASSDPLIYDLHR